MIKMTVSMIWIQRRNEKPRGKGHVIFFDHLETIKDPKRDMLLMEKNDWRDMLREKYGNGKYNVWLVFPAARKWIKIFDWKKDGVIF
jgi:hypothetical protein